MAASSVSAVVSKFYEDYLKTTPAKLKLIDAYLLYILLTGVVQFVYCCLVGTFPFNSFLSGFISAVGSFVLAGNQFLFMFCRLAIIIVFSLSCSLPAAPSQPSQQGPV